MDRPAIEVSRSQECNSCLVLVVEGMPLLVELAD